MMQDTTGDRDAFRNRVLGNVLAGRSAFEGLGDLLGEQTAHEWQALSDAAITKLESMRQAEQLVHDAITQATEKA